jgi:hypothetical protein
VVFVEGKDFHILGRFAKKLKFDAVANRSDFVVVPVHGFNPDRIKSLLNGMELTLGQRIVAFAIFDKDYRSAEECDALVDQCKQFCKFVVILDRKEIENYLLVPTVLDRAIAKKIADRSKRIGGSPLALPPGSSSLLEQFAAEKKSYVTSQYISERRRYQRRTAPAKNEATVTEEALNEFEGFWSSPDGRFRAMPGKDALSFVNNKLQEGYEISLTPAVVIDSFAVAEVPDRLRAILFDLRQFGQTLVHG